MIFKTKKEEIAFKRNLAILLSGQPMRTGDYIVQLREVRGCALACRECDFRKIHYSKACCYCVESDRATKKRHNLEIVAARDGNLFAKYEKDPQRG